MKQNTLIFNCGCRFRRTLKTAGVKSKSQKKEGVLNCTVKVRRLGIPLILGLKL